MYKDTDIIFIVTTKRGYIPQLRICGPIPNPIRSSIGLCISMLTAGVPLHQFDPITKNVVPITISNVLDDKKFEKKVEEVKIIAPVPELTESEIPVGGSNDSEKDTIENVVLIVKSEEGEVETVVDTVDQTPINTELVSDEVETVIDTVDEVETVVIEESPAVDTTEDTDTVVKVEAVPVNVKGQNNSQKNNHKHGQKK